MREDKLFLTYNQQMKKLRNDKKISCEGSSDKRILVRSGYFNLINGYKEPFVCDKDQQGNHIYFPGTNIAQLYAVKRFDDLLRSFLLRFITQVEEEIRTLTGYKFDECNDRGNIHWYSAESYNPKVPLQQKMTVISKAYSEISKSRLDYVNFYKENHEQIPTWIMIKAVNFSTFIDVLQYSKPAVPHAICELYGVYDENGKPDNKLLIGSLHWMRTIRNSCAHNERIFCLSRSSSTRQGASRIIERYLRSLRQSYTRDLTQKIFDLLVYFKYYLPSSEYKAFISELKKMLLDLQSRIHPNAFENIRGRMGIKNMEDLDNLIQLPGGDIEYNRFDKLTL